MTVTPDAEAGSVQAAATRTTTFMVKNTGGATATFNPSPECITQGGDHVTPCTVSPTSVSLAAGDKRTRRDDGLCSLTGAWSCISSTTRFVWGGNQLLWELKTTEGAMSTL